MDTNTVEFLPFEANNFLDFEREGNPVCSYLATSEKRLCKKELMPHATHMMITQRFVVGHAMFTEFSD